MVRWVIGAAVACLPLALPAQSPADWTAARNAHFEVYSQAGGKSAVSGLAWLEELRGFVLRETGLEPDAAEPLRVIAFRSPADYSPYRLESFADAYYIGSGSRNYLVLPSLEPDSFGTAAHEYGHFLLHQARLDLPPWLREGMAEVFSSVRGTAGGTRIGGDLLARAQLLRGSNWLPLPQILAWTRIPAEEDRRKIELFYAESWALVEMLALAPEYRPGFRSLVAAVVSGTPVESALAKTYGKSLDRIQGDLRARAGHRVPVTLSRADAVPAAAASLGGVPEFDIRLMLARVLLLDREYRRAGELYWELSRESPRRADVTAGLGALALAQGNRTEAQRLWKQALQQGLTDTDICYQYALLLEGGGASQDELRSALEETIRLRPSLEDARFRLALLEENAMRHQAALAQLEAMGEPPPPRAFSYFCTLSQALAGLGRGEEAAHAAEKAAESAAGADDRAHALQLVRMARTHMDVQFTRNAAGNLVLTTTRVANDAPSWNAFVEPDDDLRRVEGTLLEIECGDSGLRLLLETADGRLTVAIPDPSHVEMRNASREFVCGSQPGSRIVVEYAAAKTKGAVQGVARGIEFKK